MAKSRRNANVKLLGVVRRRRPALLVSTALCATVTMVISLPAAAQPAPNARPTGGVVVGGAASISQSTSQTTIDQSTQRGAINWQAFNVGSQQSVQFNQPSSSAVTLNQVVGPNPSQIAGKIDANGQIIIENQSGVMFYKGSQVNTAGLMVSAATSSNGAMQAFVNGGNLVMDQAANPNAAVVNQGHITIKQAGLAALVAPQVVNSGVITARLGHVVLAGATRTTLDLYGDGMMSIDVTGQVATLPNGATALVTNSGIIVADGGTVKLTARAADGLVTTLVDAGGKIQANSVGGHIGTVTLAGVGGGITVEGQLDAIGTAPGTKGGNIEVNATGNVTVASAARINASGQAGGGLIAIGTTLKRSAGGPGVSTTHTAANVTVQQGASIAANATHNGNGGRITVLSTGTTTMNGTISATGGPQGGNGGFVEWSGGTDASTTGLIDVSAPFGNLGTILLDPDDLDIVASGGNLDGTFPATGTVTTGQDGTNTDSISGTILSGFTGDVLLQAKFTIDVQSSFSLSAGSLTMEAGKEISVDLGVNVGASGDIILATGGAGPGTVPAAQVNPLIGIAGTVASSGGSVSLLAGPGGQISVGNAGLVQAASSETVTLQSDSLFLGAGRVLASGGTIEIAPATPGNAIAFAATGTTTLTMPTLLPGSIVASTLRLGAVTVGGTQTTTAGNITFDTGVNLTGVASTLDVETTGTVSQTSTGSLTVGTLTGNVTGEVSLDQAENNQIGTVGSFNAGGVVFALITTGSVTVAGPVVAPAIQIENYTNPMSVTGSLGATDLISLQTLGSLSVGPGAILNSPSVALSGVGGIALTGSAVVGQTGATVDLSATEGNVTEANTGTIIAATLQSYHGVSGTADLRGTANAIGSIGTFAGFAVTNGDFLLTDTSPLTVEGVLSAGGSIYLQTSDHILGIMIASGGTVAAGSSSLVSFQTGRFTNSGTVTGGTFELAPNTSGGEVTIGGDGDLPSLSGIGPSSVRIGAVTVPGTGLTTTAGSIVLDGTFGLSTVALELDSTGGIDGSGFALTASTLSGSAATTTSGDANFSATNTIGALGNFVVGGSASSGNFILVNSGSIAVTGSISAANATINAGTIGINGGSVVTPGSLDLTSTPGSIALTGTALLNGGTVDLASATGIAQSSSSTIIATNLTASAGAGSVVLGSLTNAIGTVTGMSASGGGVTLVVDPTTVLTGLYTGDDLFFEVAHLGGTLEIGNGATGATLSATAASNPTISFVADNVTEGGATSTITATDGSNGGTVEIAPFTSATAVFLGVTSSASGLGVDQTLLGDITTGTGGLLRIGEYTGTLSAGNISIAGAVNLGTVASTLELDSGTGSITEAGSIALSVLTLTGTAASGISLLGSLNDIGTLGTLGSTTGDILISDDTGLTVAGVVDAGSGNIELAQGADTSLTFQGGSLVVNGATIGLVTDALSFVSGSIIAGATGVVEIAPSTSLNAVNLGGPGSLGTLGVTTAAFDAIDAGTVRIGADHDRISNGGTERTTAGSIIAAGNFGSTTVSLELDSVGGITQTGGTLAALVLTGSAAAVGLLGTTNAIGTLGVFNTASGFALVDNEALLVDGPVTDTGASSTLALTTLTGGITLAGNVSTANVLDLTSAGTISQTSGSISALTLTGSATSAGLTQATNLIGTLGAFSTTAGFALTDDEALTVSGPVIDTGASSTLALTTKIGGITLDGTLSATNVLDLVSAGTIDQTGGTISAGTLVGSATSASLTQPTNLVGTLGAFSTTIGFALVNNEALLVNGPVSDTGASSTLALTTMTGGLTLAGNVSATNLLDLISAGTISQTSGSISALTLTGSATSAGLTQATNLVGTLAAFSTTAGFALTDNEALLVNGPVIDTGASSTLALTTKIGDITLAGTVSATNVLDLISAGTIDQTGGSISAGTLTGSAVTLASLLRPTNAVGTLGAFTVTGGDLLFIDDSNLTIAGAVSANDIFAKIDLAGGTLTLGSSTTGATLTASGTVSLIADNITEGSATSTITATDRGIGGTVAIAPFSSGTPVSLGGSPATGTGTLVADGTLLADITTGTLQIGSYNDAANGGAGTITAGNISVDGAVNLTGGHAGTLLLDSLGSVYESGSNGIQVATLVGSVVAGVTLANANTIATLGSFIAGGTFDLVDSGAPSLAVTGPVTAAGVTIAGAGTTTVTGAVTGASASNVFVASGSISLDGGVLSGGTVDIDSSAGGIAESNGGSIIAATLLSSLGSTGNVDLGDANSVGTLASFIVSEGTFHLDNGGTVGLAVNGPVIGSSVTLDTVAGTLAVNGTILGGSIVAGSTFATGLVSLAGLGTTSAIDLNNGAAVNGATIELNAGSVVMSGSASLGNALALIEVTTTGGGVNEAGTATILAATLEGLGTIDGSVTLPGANNTIAAIGSLAVTNGGTFSLIDNGNLGVGTLTASTITIGDAGTLTVTDSLVATTAVSLTANTILIPGEVSDGGLGTTSLIATSGSIAEGGTLIAGTLSGSSIGETSLTGTNQVNNLGSFTATGGFVLDDGSALLVAGPVNGGASATIFDIHALTVNGSVYSTSAISLTGSSIAINGSAYVSDGGSGSSTTSLVATNGTISETGTLIAGTLTGSSTGATSLTGATTITNQLLNLGSFTAASFVLNDGEALAVAGPVNGGTSASIFDAQVLTVNGSVYSTSVISLNGSSIAITGAGYVSDGGAGTTSLIATNGTINETGTLIAGTLSGMASNGGTVSTAVNLAGASAIANHVGTLGSFIASSFNLNDGSSLAVNGRLGDDTSVTIALPSSAALTINGTIIPVVLSGTVPSATNVSLTAGSITIPGTVSDGGAGTTSLIATNGAIGETGTLIAGTLSGSSSGATSLTGATAVTNQVGNLGSFTATSFVLDDGEALAVAGPVNGGTSATILDAAALTVSGSLFSTSVISLTGSSIAITGTGYVSDGGSGTTSLIATNGTINETGTLIAGTLSGSSTGATGLTGATTTTNQVADLASFSASRFTLDDGIALAVAGPVNGGTSATIFDAQALTVNGSVVSTSAISLTGSSIAITGAGYVSDGGAGTTSLIATNGTINETGTLIAGTLSGSSTGETSLAGATTTINQVANLASFSADGFLLNDGIALAVAGPVNGGTSATILDAAALTVNGSLFSTSVMNLTASSITINGGGFVSDGGSGTTSLIATAGTINEIGTLIAGTLSGSSTGATNLAGATATTNQVANLGSFSATAGNFVLDDGESLTVAGSINSGGTIIIGDTGGFTNNATISSTSNTTITATGSLTNDGQIGEAGGKVLLSAGSDIANNGLIFGLQNGTLLAGADISNNGSIGFNGNATLIAVGSINDTSNGVITAGGVGPAVLLVAQTGSISEASGGTIAATNPSGADVQLTAQSTTNGNIVVAGAITASGSLSVVGLAAGGSITQSGGSIVAGGPGTIVSGTLVPSIALVAQTGTIGQSAGAVVSATNAAGAIQLAAPGNITFAGTISAPGTASIVSLASGATIAETAASGILQAGTLIGSAGNGATLTATSGIGNLVANLGSFITGTTGAGNFVLVDEENLAVIAPVTASDGSVAITATHFGTLAPSNLTNDSTVMASGSVTLLADNDITNNDPVIAQGGTVSLIASAGTLTNNATVQASTSATLMAGTDITNNNSVIAQGGTVSLIASTGTLTNNDMVLASTSATLSAGTDITNNNSVIAQGGIVSLIASAGTLTNNDLVQASASATLSAGTNITNNGSVIAQTGSASLTATAGMLSNTGLIDANTSTTLQADTGLTNTNTGSVIAQTSSASLTASAGTLANAGLILASTDVTLVGDTGLSNTGSVIAQTGNATLTATAGTLFNSGLIRAGSGVFLTAGGDLTTTGSAIAQDGDAVLDAGGALTNSGLVQASASVSMQSLAGLTNTNTGSVIAQTSFASLVSTGGTLANAGLIQASTSVTLLGDTGLSNTGSVIAQTSSALLTASAGTLANAGLILASTSVTLLGDTGLSNTGSVIAQTGNATLTATAGALFNSDLVRAGSGVFLTAGGDLTTTGSAIAQDGGAVLDAGGALTNSGLVQASASVSMQSVAGLTNTNTGSVIAQTSFASLTSTGGALANAGLILASTNVTLVGDTGLSNTGSVIAQTGNATLTATLGTLFNSGLISAAAANAVVALTANGGPIIQSGSGAGMIAGGSVVLNASGGITLNGLVSDDLEVVLNAGGAISQNGTLIADLLTGSAGGTVDLAGATLTANQVANLGSFTAGGTFTLNDGINLTISGLVSAANIIINDGSHTISLGNGGFDTDGANRPPGALTALQLPPNAITTLGAYLAAGSVIQTGSSFTVNNTYSGLESILSITLPVNGNGTLMFSSNGLVAPNTWLILSVGNGAAGGPIDVKALDFAYSPPPGRADFTGLIDGLSGAAGAGAAFIQPQPNSNFRVDGCPIHSVNCELLATEGVPAAPPLGEINVGAPLNEENPEDLVLPVVSDERYELVPCDDPTKAGSCPAIASPRPLH